MLGRFVFYRRRIVTNSRPCRQVCILHTDSTKKQSDNERVQALMNDDFISSLRKEFQQKANEITSTLSRSSWKNHHHPIQSRKEWIPSTIAYLLRQFPSMQNSTYKLMNFDEMSYLPPKSSFLHLYMEGIPGFIQRLQEEGNCDLLCDDFLALLEQNGFQDAKLLEQHSFSKKYYSKYDKLNNSLQYRYKKLHDAQRKLKNAQNHNQQQQQTNKKRNTQMSQPHNKVSNEKDGLYHSMIDSLANLFLFASPPSEETLSQRNLTQNGSNTIQEDTKKQKLVQNLEEKVKNAQLDVGKIQKQMMHLNESHNLHNDEYSLTLLSRKKYSQVNRFINDKIVKDLSRLYSLYLQECQQLWIEKHAVLKKLTDLTQPQTWYGKRQLKRKIIFHTGPTNSGKTYQALIQLKQAKRGLYLGPLRLLAAEVYEHLLKEGIPTNLYTGQERKEMLNATHMACTTELAPTTNEIDQHFDVAIIDEIQMIRDEFRGFAWTRALLGLKCNEIHVCGGIEARDIVENIAHICGDEFELEEYERFTPLVVSEESFSSQPNNLGSYSKVQPGDCVIAFSRNDIFAIQREIENTTPYKCCVIYGSLPPQIRSEQAQRFNDPESGYDILVASDAIGMGLNLHIRRIIFNSMYKSNGEKIVKLDASTIQQISGRAGRRNSPHSVGEVTCRNPLDMPHLRHCMNMVIPPIEKAGLLPTSYHIKQFATALEELYHSSDSNDPNSLKGTNFYVDSERFQEQELHNILTKFTAMATLHIDYFLCRQTQIHTIAKVLSDMPLSLDEKYSLCMAPVNENCQRSLSILKNFALEYKEGNFFSIDRMVSPPEPKSFRDLTLLCNMHAELDLLLWLWSRFDDAKHDKHNSEHEHVISLKDETISLINRGLADADQLDLDHCYIEKDKRIRSSWKKESDEKDFNNEYNLNMLTTLLKNN